MKLDQSKIVQIATETVIGLLKDGYHCDILTSEYATLTTLRLSKPNKDKPHIMMVRNFNIPITPEIAELINLQKTLNINEHHYPKTN